MSADNQDYPGPADVGDTISKLGRRIAEAREASSRTQEDVAHALGIAVRNYQNIERGRQNLTINTIVKIANELGVDPRDLWAEPSTAKRGPGRPSRR